MSLQERVYQLEQRAHNLELLFNDLKQSSQDTRDLFLNMKCNQDSFQAEITKTMKEIVDMHRATNQRISHLEQNLQEYVKSQEVSQSKFQDEFSKFQTEVRVGLQQVKEAQVAQSQSQQQLKEQIKAELSIEMEIRSSWLSSYQYINHLYSQSQFHDLPVAYQPYEWSLDLITNQAQSVSQLDSQLSILSNYRWFLTRPLSSELPSQSDKAASDQSDESNQASSNT